ncbi:LytR/AlgR family response regulator transcription factor [Adhaeribacter radiodurans]|uniref:LytTR family transcriptional regulator n=1 Tax=Adhaeribacter radiodurans TaxID=2745197 RepID=A0A7L7LE77_9BACT|nr:LytTR family DNA-binding domain-containing protein [Adhaeribacter radiodurans]QMU31121.1 LytTR family transcriptional regulator [Adhaeribacter radiodurans]
MENKFEIKYRDKVFFPVFIIVMGVINLYIAYGEFYLNKKYLTGLLLDSFEVTCAWLAVRYIIHYLDQKYPYQQNFIRRILLQLLLTSVVALAILIFFTESINYLITNKPVPREVYTHHLWVFEIWLLVMNSIYVTLYFIQWSSFLAKKKQEPELELPKAALLTKLGNKSTVLSFADICYCTIASDLTLIYSTKGESHLIEKSLEQLEQILPPDQFFRANRQFIIHRNLVQAIERIENGKINILVKPCPKLPEVITISRAKAPAFKEWLKLAAV